MIADIVRAAISIYKRDIDKALKNSPENKEFDVFETTSIELIYKSYEIMNSGVHFYLGDLKAIDNIVGNSVTSLDGLIRQLNIIGAKLPYPRMSISIEVNINDFVSEEAPYLEKKTGICKEKISLYLNPNNVTKTNFCLLIDSITDDLAFGCTWFSNKPPTDLLSWGTHTHATLISLYNDFKNIKLPHPEIFAKKGLSFINAYRNQIKEADSCVLTIPTSPREVRLKSSTSQFTDTAIDKDHEDHDLLQMELFRFLFLLNTKGVGIQNIPTNVKKNKKRKKLNNYPLLDYKILKIDTLKIGQPHNSQNNPSEGTNRIHSCRGHIKIYNIEKPLFGHYSGPVWVKPHIRGKGALIMKDYEIKNPK